MEVTKYPYDYITKEVGTWIIVIHMPSGLHAKCQDFKSPHKNRQACMDALEKEI